MSQNRGKLDRSRREVYTKILGVPLQKGIRQGDGSLLVTGFFTSDAKDEVGDIITRGATERAIPKYRQWGNIRYMHQPRPVGKVTRIGSEDSLKWNEVEIRVIEPESVFQVEEGLLAALSVGIYFTWEDIEILEDGGWLINDYSLAEISLVDHPANYDAVLSNIMKGAVLGIARTRGKDAALSYLDGLREDITLEGGELTSNLAVEAKEDVLTDTEPVVVEASPETDLEEGIIDDIVSGLDDEGTVEELDEEPVVEPEEHTEESIDEVNTDLEEADKSVVPYSDTGTADKEQSWSKPALKDFTDDGWGDLSASERRRIAKHYTWSENMPPETFGDLKLPHHNASREGVGPAVWRGVAAAYSRLHQANTQIPDGDISGCESHLEKHYAQFDEEPPEKAIPVENESDVESVENIVPAEDIEAEGVVTTAELEIHSDTQLDLYAVVRSLQLEFGSFQDDVKALVEALQKEGRSEGEDPNEKLEEAQAEVTRLAAEVESLKAERDSLRKELDELRLPAERLGGIPGTELPEEKEADVEEDEGQDDQPSLKQSIRNYLVQRYPIP